jgi:predicted AAA+ superfamily ATPase
MLKRKAKQRLLKWKQEAKGRTALLIEGARRVGKSTLVQEFGASEYESHILIDFTSAPDDVLDYFRDHRDNLDAFFMYLSAYYRTPLHERNSLIVFDEVQAFPKAREFIKQLVADGRYDFIETGSLVSIKKNVKDILIPSEERAMRLNPFDFEEFLWAMEEEPLAKVIRNSFAERAPMPVSLHRKAMRLFREYMLIGGMPQVLQDYAQNRDFEAADEIKRDIIMLYRNDIAKHADTSSIRVTSIFDNIAGQLSRHEKRFNLAALGENARMRNYEDAFFWLSDAFVTNNCHKADDPRVGLRLHTERTRVKCYMADTGLLVTHALATLTSTPQSIYRDILLEKIGLNEGMFTENIIAQQLRASGHELFFYSSSDRNNADNNMEIDFLIISGYVDAAMRARVSPIEVKSTKRFGTSSLDKFKHKFGKNIGAQYVICPKELSANGDRITLPLYMAGCL